MEGRREEGKAGEQPLSAAVERDGLRHLSIKAAAAQTDCRRRYFWQEARLWDQRVESPPQFASALKPHLNLE